jgi:hypothetical protein
MFVTLSALKNLKAEDVNGMTVIIRSSLTKVVCNARLVKWAFWR